MTPVPSVAVANAAPARRSLRGLDALNFFMADVQGGLGPYLSVFLAGRRWHPGAVGIAMAATSIASALFQIPAGLLVDQTRQKRLLVVLAGLLIAGACIVIARLPHVVPVIGAQVAIGAAAAIVPPVLAALALGLAGRAQFDATISRNQTFNHAGNFVAAGLAGVLGQFVDVLWIFYLICGFAIASALSVLMIDPQRIDHEAARGGEQHDPGSGRAKPVPLRALLRQRNLLVFLASVALFHFGNAAMLPMAGQKLARAHPGEATIALSACIIVAQLVMTGVAWAVGRAVAGGYGRKSVFLVAYALLPIRGVLFSMTSSAVGVVAIQVLDGVAAGIFGVVAVMMAADLMRGTGRFNLAQGLVALCVGLGATLSNAISGYIVQWFGFSVGFLALAAVALGALLFFALLMPETKPASA